MPQRSHGWFRRWFRKVWEVRGGGLYATGFALSFFVYEALDLVEDLANINMLWNGQAIEFLIKLGIDWAGNMVQAFIWPAHVAQFASPWGAVGLGLAFWLFPIYVKPHIERWMFDEEKAEVDPPT